MFNSGIVHDGGVLTGGTKFILRSEVMYRAALHEGEIDIDSPGSLREPVAANTGGDSGGGGGGSVQGDDDSADGAGGAGGAGEVTGDANIPEPTTPPAHVRARTQKLAKDVKQHMRTAVATDTNRGELAGN